MTNSQWFRKRAGGMALVAGPVLVLLGLLLGVAVLSFSLGAWVVLIVEYT